MDVTRQNFATVLPLVERCINSADFLAVDCEFTGIRSDAEFTTDNCYDTLEERYEKILKGSSNFLLLQLGLSSFKFNKATSDYDSNTFNFYVFPVPFSRQAPDRKFLCQTSSLDFLISQGFDFNKTFKEGIPYLSLKDEMNLKMKLQERHNIIKATSPAFTSPNGPLSNPPIKSPAVVPDEQKTFLNGILEAIKKFLTNSKDTQLELPPCTAFQRKLIYQSAGLEFGSKIFLETITMNPKERYIKVSRVNNELDLKDKELRRQASEMDEIDKAVGFSKVIRMISKAGKLIVGHNMYLDLVHIFSHFHVPLPDTYEQFKSAVHCLFPLICDTKLMSNMHPFRELIPVTVLDDLDRCLKSKPFKNVKLAGNKNGTTYGLDNVGKLHEAGYDAVVTGLCFIRMSNHLGSYQSPQQKHVPPHSALLKPFINKVFVTRIADIPYMDIVGTDLNPSRENVFHVRVQENKTWNYNDVRQYFASTGILSVGWIDETSFLVGIPHDSVDAVSSIKPTSACTVTAYKAYKRESRKRSYETIASGRDTGLSVESTYLNVNARPFVSRGSSPVPADPQPEERTHASKRPRVENDGEKTSKRTDAKDKITDEKVFDVPEDW